MKKLFLASFAAHTLSKSFEILPDVPSKLSVAFITTAANPYEKKDWIDEDRNALLAAGFRVTDFDMGGKNSSELREFLTPFDVIFVAGGNSYYLLEKMRESGFDILIHELLTEGKVYMGSSAGSVVVGPNIDIARRFDDPTKAPNLTSYEGLGLVNFVIFPHYGYEKYKDRQDEVVREWDSQMFPLRLLTNKQAIIVVDDIEKMVEVA